MQMYKINRKSISIDTGFLWEAVFTISLRNNFYKTIASSSARAAWTMLNIRDGNSSQFCIENGSGARAYKIWYNKSCLPSRRKLAKANYTWRTSKNYLYPTKVP